MTYRELDTVVLNRDLPEHSLQRGDVGAIVHLHAPDAMCKSPEELSPSR